MPDYIQVWRAKVADDDVDQLLAVRPAAIAEAQRLCPELIRAEPVARQLDAVIAIGDLYRFDRFAAPAALWDDLQRRFPALLAASEEPDHGG